MESLNNVKIRLRTDDLSNWTASNPILGEGEFAIVVDENGREGLKIGNGVSCFNDLKYLNQEEFKTERVLAREINAKSISQGYNVKSTPTSFATGIFTQADGNFGVVHGIEARILSTDNYAFVFNGTNLPLDGENFYQSHGEGTFNVNPKDGLSGFYVGEENLSSIIQSRVSDAIFDTRFGDFQTFSMIKPYSEHSISAFLEFSLNGDFTDAISVSQGVSPSLFSAFDGEVWHKNLVEYGIAYNNKPVNVDLKTILSSNGIFPTKDTVLFAKYQWAYVDSENVRHGSDWYSTVIPTNTEVGANANDTVGKSDFQTLTQLVVPQTNVVQKSSVYEGYYTVSQYNVNELSGEIQDNEKIVLYAFGDNYRYYLNFKTVSSDSDISLKFYTDNGNGPEYRSDLQINSNSFKSSSEYKIEIFHDQIIVQNIDKRDFVQYSDKIVANQFKRFQVIKPYSVNKTYMQLEFSESMDFSNSISVDSSVSCDCFYGLRIAEDKTEWKVQDSQGFTVEFNNQPVMVDFEKILKANSLYPDLGTVIYARYQWYYVESSARHYSDMYSMVLPSNTEVGANSKDVASKREFEALESEVNPVGASVGLDSEYELYYEAYDGKYTQVSDTLASNARILLKEFDKSKTYLMKFTTAAANSNVTLKFYYDVGNGPEYDSTMKINNNSFMTETEYSIRISHDCLEVQRIGDQDVVNYLKENSNSVTLRRWNI